MTIQTLIAFLQRISADNNDAPVLLQDDHGDDGEIIGITSEYDADGRLKSVVIR